MKKKNSAIIGAAFMMATSAIGPGFLTQTSLFTQELLASFGFVILISVVLDIGVQLNIWRIITMSGLYAQDISNKLVPGVGYLLAGLIAFGGLVFNIGNVAGTGMGFFILTGLSIKVCAIISSIIAILIFWAKDASKVIDLFVKVLGLLMIGLTIYVAISSNPPIGEALHRTFLPQKINFLTIITIVGGTVGGYISFTGAHRLLQAGIKSKENLPEISKSATSGILITSFMRYILFLAALGVVVSGVALNKDNPASTVFQSAAGKVGYIFFGIVLWVAAITSVVGASYTSVSFWKTLSPFVAKHEKIVVTLFIATACLLFCINPQPVQLLVLAGAVNGLILPIALAIMLVASNKKELMQDYKHPLFLKIFGWVVVVVMSVMGIKVLIDGIGKLF